MKTKVTVVGGGNVGATVAQGIALKELADVVVVDIVEGVPQGKSLDLMETAPGREIRLDPARHEQLRRDRGLRRRRHHRRPAAQAGHEPRRPALEERGDRRRRHARGREALAELRSSSSSPIRSTRCAKSRAASPASRASASSAWPACSTPPACAPSSPWSSTSPSKTPTPSSSAATATRWCRCRATRPWPASRSPS